MAEPDRIETLLAAGPDTPAPDPDRLRVIEARVLAASARGRRRRLRLGWWLAGLLAVGAATAAAWWTAGRLDGEAEPAPAPSPNPAVVPDEDEKGPQQTRPAERIDEEHGTRGDGTPGNQDRTIYEREVY